MLVGGAGEVEGQLVAFDGRFEVQLDVLLVGLEDVACLVNGIR